MDSLFGLLNCVAILFAKMLIWAPYSQSMSTFCFCINPRTTGTIANSQTDSGRQLE